MGAYEFSNTDFHPADTNSNWVLEATEFTTYSDAWRNDQPWGAASKRHSADYVTRAGYLKERRRRLSQHGATPVRCAGNPAHHDVAWDGIEIRPLRR